MYLCTLNLKTVYMNVYMAQDSFINMEVSHLKMNSETNYNDLCANTGFKKGVCLW